MDKELLQKEAFLYVAMLLVGAGATELSAKNYLVALGLLATGLVAVATRGYLKSKGVIKKK